MPRLSAVVALSLLTSCPAFEVGEVRCGESGLCPSDRVCDPATGVCIVAGARCEDSSECTSGWVCDPQDHHCRPCTLPIDCDSRVCDPAAGICAACEEVVLVGVAEGGHACGSRAIVVPTLREGLAEVTNQRIYVAAVAAFRDRGLHAPSKLVLLGHGRGGLHFNDDSQGEEPLLYVDTGSDVRIHDFSLNSNAYGPAISCSGSALTLQDVWISGNEGPAVTGDCDIEITHSSVEGNRSGIRGRYLKVHHSRFLRNGDGSVIEGVADRADIRGNLIALNGRGGYAGIIQLSNEFGEPPGAVAFNTLVGNSHNGYERGVISCSGGDVETDATRFATVESNIIWNHVYPEGGGTIGYNHVWGCYVGSNVINYPYNLETITEDPLLLGPEDDFRPMPGSSAVNVGDPALALELDLAGQSRGLEPDMGAFEAE